MLSRIQFGLTISFHYIFPPLSIGLGVILVIMEGLYLKTGKKLYENMTKFWVKIFSLTFAMGVATGIVMEFEFGTNWASYSRYVGDIFGSPLAAEGIFAFFLESGFLAILLFGWDKVSPKVHFLSTVLVALGATMSAIWIIVANSWMQTPGVIGETFHIVGSGMTERAEILDFWGLVFNDSMLERLSHTLSGAWLAGATLVTSVSGWYLLKGKHKEYAVPSLKIALGLAVFASLFQLFTGHLSADGIAKNQPAKLAAFEGHFDTGPADMYILGWVDEKSETTTGIKIPGMLSYLIYFDKEKPVTGLKEFLPEDRPPVNPVFQSYHIMVGIGMMLIGYSFLGVFLWIRGKLPESRFFLKLSVLSVLLPQIANQLGWFSAEVGRQPWIVYGLLRTRDALSKSVDSGEVWFSLILFTLIYSLLFFLFLFLLDRKIKHGPESLEESDSVYTDHDILHNKN